MSYKAVFKRYEFKYMITSEQRDKMLTVISEYMRQDRYGKKTVRNIYFDTENYRLIRTSIDKPVYKEKLRVRCYDRANPDSEVFVELKKKYGSVVYKRRISMPEKEAMAWLCCKDKNHPITQITREVDYFMEYYENLLPSVFLSYEREAFHAFDGSDLRITFDEKILFRTDDLCLCSEVSGTPILEDGKILLEIKTSGGMPMWLASFLSSECIYKISFSKYGMAYKNYILPNLKEKGYYVGTF